MTSLSILTATDLSAAARHAVDRGFLLAAETGAPYSVVHAIELDAVDSLREALGSGAPEIKQRLEEQAREELARLVGEPSRHQGVAADAQVVVGAPLTVILSHAEAIGAGLLILGASGEAALRHILLGSTAWRLLRKQTSRPVLVVKQPPAGPYQRLLIAIDFSPISAAAIRLGKQLAPAADIVLLHAFDVPFEGKLARAGVEESVLHDYRRLARTESMRRLHQLAEAAGLAPGSYWSLALHGDPFHQIISREQEQGCDLIIVGKQGQHVVDELLLGSVTKHVLAESRCDVLVLAKGLPSQEEEFSI